MKRKEEWLKHDVFAMPVWSVLLVVLVWLATIVVFAVQMLT